MFWAGRKARVHMISGRQARFLYKVGIMRVLSIFVDESGDFGEYSSHSPYYIISLVFHNQDEDITEDCKLFENALAKKGFPNHCVHVGPLVRGEEEYRNVDIETRKSILRRMKTFFTHVPVEYKSFYIKKSKDFDEVIAAGLLSKQISTFISNHLEFFIGFDKIIIYYDNGQIQINKILAAVFGILLNNVEFRKVLPSEYRLFQVADFTCSMQLIRLKAESKSLSKSEKYFFNDYRTLKKQFFKPMDHKEM